MPQPPKPEAMKLPWRAELTPGRLHRSSTNPLAVPGWIARGKLTSGGRWPDGEICTELGSALIWSSEDDPVDTLVPRLIAAGADLSRVHIVQGWINSLGEQNRADALERLAELIRGTGKTEKARHLGEPTLG